MSFEVMGMNYDATRKVSTMQTFKSVNKKQTKWSSHLCLFHIILICNLVSFLKLNEDAIQILEQILPYFQPAFNLTIDLSRYYWRKKRYANHSRRNTDGR